MLLTAMPMPIRMFALALLAAVGFAAPAAACTVSSSVTTALGTYSPNAVRTKVVPALQSRAGLQCSTAVLTLLGNNSIKATFTSANGLKLVRSGGGSVAYAASADSGGTVPIAQNATIDYMQNNLLNLLGLLGGSNADLPFFIKPGDTTLPAQGIYTDRITVKWDWQLCSGGIGLAGACIGTRDVGTGTSIVDVTLTVSQVSSTITLSTTTTWDPINGTSNPRALPGSRRATTATFANPDIATLEGTSIDVILPTPAGVVPALDGDGASSGAAITLTDGAPASSMTLRYTDASDAGDDVDFSADGGTTWSYVPVAGNVASESAITHIRMRARGTMSKSSSFAVRVPYLVR